MIRLFILVVIVLLYFMVKPKNVYSVAHDLAIHFLNTINPQPNFAVMFDIDDTLISLKDKPIKPIIKLVGECNKRGIKVLILTARDSVYTQETVQDLIDNGIYPNFENYKIPKTAVYYDYLYLRKSPQDNHELFKSNVKERFAKNGIHVIMSIGDNDIDVVGKYSGYAIKLPNTHDPRLFHKDNTLRMVQVKVI